jgi:glutamyl/glutaminyl-tRNA synthetase
MTECFFKDDFAFEDKAQAFLEKEENRDTLALFAGRLEALEDFSKESIEKACRELAEEKSLKAAQIIHPTRAAISGKTAGAGLFEMMELLGKERVLRRLRKAV